jgi:hypothetical protein
MLHPTAAKELLGKVEATVRQRSILVAVFGLIGVYLIGKGLAILHRS